LFWLIVGTHLQSLLPDADDGEQEVFIRGAATKAPPDQPAFDLRIDSFTSTGVFGFQPRPTTDPDQGSGETTHSDDADDAEREFDVDEQACRRRIAELLHQAAGYVLDGAGFGDLLVVDPRGGPARIIGSFDIAGLP
jgi:hypothetical protein